MSNDTTRLTVTVTRETDLALRAYLGAQGMRKGDLFRFIKDSVRWRMFDRTVQAVKECNASMDPDALQTLIDDACEALRSEMWPVRPPGFSR